MTVPVKGILRHSMPGRLRVVLEQPLPARGELQALAAALAGVEGVREVEIRPHSGSVIVRHDGDFERLEKALGEAGLAIEAEPEADEPVDLIEQVVERLSLADTVLQRASSGKTDIWNVAFAALVAGGFIQLARGRVSGPALTLFGQAATVAMSRPLRRFLG
ncbi:MAG: hypothetical protein PHE36_10385 [Novosphingobium sp.]|nr:hypothetical protein [Novosphingobium sp.]